MDSSCSHLLRIVFSGLARGVEIFFCTVLLIVAGQSTSLAEMSGTTVRIYFENDLFYGSDSDYTNAVEARIISPELLSLAKNGYLPDKIANILDKASFPGARKAPRYNISLGLGQHIYTPEETQVTFFQEDDRPYAGYLYGALALHAKRYERLDTIELAAGIIGPSSLSEQSQNTAHRTFSIDTAKGWEHQLRDEPAFMLTWSRVWRLNEKDNLSGWSWDILPQFNLSAGTPFTRAGLGTVVRFGWNLPRDYGSSIIRPGSGVKYPEREGTVAAASSCRKSELEDRFRCYVFAGFDGYAHLWNSFLDGNIWKESHSVDKFPLTGQANWGITAVFHDLQLSYTHVWRTREFHGQGRYAQFGVITLGYRF